MPLKNEPVKINPFELSEDEIRLIVGELTTDEMRCVKAVLNGIRKKLHNVHMNDGMTHADACWAWGPVHYLCAYNRIVAINKEHPAMSTIELIDMAATLKLKFEDVERVARAVESHHSIGGTR